MRNFVKIEKIEAKECLDSSGNPAVMVELQTDYGDIRKCCFFFR